MAVELKVNVINQLKLLRQSTFKDIYCFLDEDVQNAQRAKATEVKVTIDRYENKVIIENNGNILTNPQALFSIAESGWDENVRSSENPFGMGFFSNITVSNLINVHSGNTYITFDVEKMIATSNTEIEVEELDDYYDGFKLVLNNFDFETANSWDIEERVKILGKYVHELDIYYNGELVEKKDLTEGDDSEYQFSIEDNDCSGWIALAGNYSWGDNVNIFYKGRLVSKLENFPYLKGDLHVSDKTLNLTSPDRKDIIKDEKLNAFRDLVKLYVEEYCNSLLTKGIEDINNYSSCIGYYVNKKNVKNLIKFMTFKSNNEEDIKYLKGVAVARRKDKNIDSFKGYELFLRKEAASQNEQLDKIYFEFGGGGNSYESYTAAWYFGSRHTKLDCLNRRRKGIIITMGDEQLNPYLPFKSRGHGLSEVTGDNLQSDVETKDLYEEASQKFNIYHLDVNHGHRWDEEEIEKSYKKYLDDTHFRRVTMDSITNEIVDIIVSEAENNVADTVTTPSNSEGITW